MKSGRSWPCLAAALAMAMASGCGTVVTFFPYKSAEKAADRIIDDVLTGTNGGHAPANGELAKAPEPVVPRAEKTEGKAP
ncbi:MAG: hypothetical protein JNN20_09070 [Betaproteobacteria bacterium]|nr:hypothetical protein [Betaproteobacteria bacterium]